VRLWVFIKKGVYEYPICHSNNPMTISALDLGWPYFSISIQLCYHPQYISRHIFAILIIFNLLICIVYAITYTYSFQLSFVCINSTHSYANQGNINRFFMCAYRCDLLVQEIGVKASAVKNKCGMRLLQK
jgi:hypothetical protein